MFTKLINQPFLFEGSFPDSRGRSDLACSLHTSYSYCQTCTNTESNTSKLGTHEHPQVKKPKTIFRKKSGPSGHQDFSWNMFYGPSKTVYSIPIFKNLLPCVLFYRFKLLFRETVSGVLSDLGNNSLGLLLHRLKPEQAQIWVILAFPAWCIDIHKFQTDNSQSSKPNTNIHLQI